MRDVLAELGLSSCDRVLLDLGVSSMQIDTPERGFSFQVDGPLDMRMNRDAGQPLSSWLARVTEQELADVIYRYGEERHSRAIARAIVAARQAGGLTRTAQLAEVVRRATKVSGRQRIHPATRTFQALRIALNDELGELERGLAAALECLVPHGRLAVISFHSLEDRIVKRFLREQMDLPFRKPQVATAEECRANPRARSARLRCGVKRGGPAARRRT
jgi:16S rRNA (cytosine1402-N4)-methyltransferase